MSKTRVRQLIAATDRAKRKSLNWFGHLLKMQDIDGQKNLRMETGRNELTRKARQIMKREAKI